MAHSDVTPDSELTNPDSILASEMFARKSELLPSSTVLRRLSAISEMVFSAKTSLTGVAFLAMYP